ncbi:MAG: DoxX family protein [Bacteroidales bacterium]|nr:DoxX family protein [Bacteroidales bacterium]MDD4210210.1 DoxX family protein [Bacteroidales bacterium]
MTYTHSLHKEKRNGMYYIRHFSRLFIGLLFIFSGYVKGVDPFGFALKIEEYLVSFGLDFMTPLAMTLSILAILAECIIGIALLFNIQMKLTSWALFLFMGFFTVLTFWLAYAIEIVDIINSIFNKNYSIFVVSDCGCFGDFIVLSNTETFYKNIIFFFFTLIIVHQRKKYKYISLHYITQWLPILIGAIFVLFMTIHCLRHEPWHDFRPWNKGNFIAAETYSEAPVLDYVFQYKNNKNNTIVEYTIDDLTQISEDSVRNDDFETNYTYVDRKEKIVKEGINAQLSDFTLIDMETNQDLKKTIIEQAGYHFILFIHNISKVNLKNFDDIKEFAKKCEEEQIPFIAVTGSTPKQIEQFKQSEDIDFIFYYSDETPLKTAIRNNPGFILLKDGYVIDKWSFRDIPTYEIFKKTIPTYDAKLKKYKSILPPTLPNKTNLDSINYSTSDE